MGFHRPPHPGSNGEYDPLPRPEDIMRAHLESVEVLAKGTKYNVLHYLVAMALAELNEVDGLSRLEALVMQPRTQRS